LTGTSLFLFVFGVVLASIGIVVFCLLAWFKGGSTEENTVKLFRAEFRISHPALVIFVVGCIFVALPFLMQEATSAMEQGSPNFTELVNLLVESSTPTPDIYGSPIESVTPLPTATLTTLPTPVPSPTPTPTASPTPTSPPTPPIRQPM
jgi:hypothetical protein